MATKPAASRPMPVTFSSCGDTATVPQTSALTTALQRSSALSTGACDSR
jgi:hypothetical protein